MQCSCEGEIASLSERSNHKPREATKVFIAVGKCSTELFQITAIIFVVPIIA